MKEERNENQKTFSKENAFYWLGAIIILFFISFVLLVFSETQLPTVFTSSGLVAIISAIIGVLLTVFVTQILLNRQSVTQKDLLKEQATQEQKKEFDTKKFEEKLNTYQSFLDKLCENLKKDKISPDEAKELIFEIAKVRLHTKEKDNIIALFSGIENIITTKTKKGGLADIADLILEVVETLQKELYLNEIQNLSKNDRQEITESIKKLMEIIIDEDMEKENPQEKTEISDTDDIKVENVEVYINDFAKELEKKLKKEIANFSDYEIGFKIGANNNFHFGLSNVALWGENYWMSIGCDNNDRLNFGIGGAAEKDYKDMYIDMRRSWGGRYWKGHWWVPLQEKYQGIKALIKPDDDMITEVCNFFINGNDYLTLHFEIRKLRDEVNKRNTNTVSKNLNIWIYTSYKDSCFCLVYEYEKLNDNYSNIVIDTYFDKKEELWTMYLSNRSRESEKISTLFTETLKEHNLVPVFFDGINRFKSESYSSSEIAEKLLKLREMVEAKLKDEKLINF